VSIGVRARMFVWVLGRLLVRACVGILLPAVCGLFLFSVIYLGWRIKMLLLGTVRSQ